jgi:hypothetical protein
MAKKGQRISASRETSEKKMVDLLWIAVEVQACHWSPVAQIQRSLHMPNNDAIVQKLRKISPNGSKRNANYGRIGSMDCHGRSGGPLRA